MDQFGRQTKSSYMDSEKPTYLTKYQQFISNLLPKPYKFAENTSELKEKETTKKTTTPESLPQDIKTGRNLLLDPTSSKNGNVQHALSISTTQKAQQPNLDTLSPLATISSSERLHRKRLLTDDATNGGELQSVATLETAPRKNDIKTRRKLQPVAPSETVPRANDMIDTKKIQSIVPSTTVHNENHMSNGRKLQSVAVSDTVPHENDNIRTGQLPTLKEESMKAYECQICSFETIYESSFREHMLTHKKTKKETFHKCPRCPFRIKCKASVRKHMAVINLSENVVYCGLYSYSAKCKGDLDLHLSEHKDDSAQNMSENSYASV